MIATSTITAVASGVTALLGLYVAALAARGYRSHGSRTMGALAVGIVAITTVPFLVAHVLGPALALSDGLSILAIMLSHTIGLLAIYATLR